MSHTVPRLRSRALWLALEPDPVFAVLHEATGAQQPTAVLMCPPFGWEENASYRGRRKWAAALADAGYPTARISLPSTGDSGGLPEDPDRLTAWTSAVAGAAGWLRLATGCRRVVAIGIGLGGMLALRAVAEGAAIDDLVLWAVPARGRMLVRELRAYAAVAGAGQSPRRDDGSFAALGYLMSAQTATELGELALTDSELPEAQTRRVLMLERDRLGVDHALREHLERSGASVTVAAGGSYSMLISGPQEARMPEQAITATIRWLAEGRDSPERTPEDRLEAPAERGSIELAIDDAAVRESLIGFETSAGRGFAVLSEPVGGQRLPVCGVLLNAGTLAHTGPNRVWVEVARRWAARGVPTVRVDLEGIGEADGDENQHRNNAGLYDRKMTDQAIAVLDVLEREGVASSFALAGLCSGAYWSLHAALADSRVAGVFMINLYALRWSRALVSARDRSKMRESLRIGELRQLASERVSVRKVGRAVRSVSAGTLRLLRRGSVETAQASGFDEALTKLRRQDAEVLLLLSEGEPLRQLLVRAGRVERLDEWPNVSVEMLPSADHLFRDPELQSQVINSLSSALDRLLSRRLRITSGR